MNRRVRFAVWRDAVRMELSNVQHRLKRHKLLYRFSVVLLSIVLLLLVGFVGGHFLLQADLDALLVSAGSFAPFIIIGLIILEVVFAPIPGTFIMVASGALFGVWLGALYSYIGNVIGSFIAFWLARRFGRPLVEKLASRKLLDRYNGFFDRYQRYVLLFYCLPIIPVDILSFSCGLSGMRRRRFLLVIFVGFIPNTLLLAFAGDLLAGLSVFLMVIYMLLLLAVLSLLAWLFRVVAAQFAKRR